MSKNEITVNGCSDCPFCYEYDMGNGYGCKLESDTKTIKQTKFFQPITPNWCPLKNQEVVVKIVPNNA